MSKKFLTVLFIGDIIGQSGMRAVVTNVNMLKRRHDVDLVIANGENAHENGMGIGSQEIQQLFTAGVQVITTGNHVWRDSAAQQILNEHEYLLRPANYPPGLPGNGSCTLNVKGINFAVINLQGRHRMYPIDCPFRKMKDMMRTIRNIENLGGVMIDFHAEDMAETEAFGYYADGIVSAMFGTHTHVQTNDERILPQGTAYISDVGACTPHASVIGFDQDIGIRRAITQLPLKSEPAQGRAVINAVIVQIDPATRKAHAIERIQQESAV